MLVLGRVVKVLLSGAFLILQPLFLFSQERREAVEPIIRAIGEFYMENMEGMESPENLSMEMVLEHLEYLAEHPVDINSAARGVLEDMMLLSDFQIESILEYRSKSGALLGGAELSLLYGFDEKSVEMLLPFITFGKGKQPGRRVSGFHSELYMKSYRRLERDTVSCGSPYYLQLKYKFDYGRYIEGGIVLENDAGEYLFAPGAPIMDHFSFHVAVRDYGRLKTLVVGDFSARFGQGLVLWNSFSLYGGGNPMSLFRRGSRIVPYMSSEENNFYRGIAAAFSFGRVELSGFCSYNRLDAKVVSDKYTSLPSGGLHNTPSSIASRKKMHEGVAGLNLSYLFNRFKLEFSWATYAYDKKNGKKLRDDNRYRMYDGLWGNCSMSLYAVFGRAKIFGEAAVDYGGSCALLFGTLFPLSDRWDMGILGRCYQKSYTAAHASAYSTLSYVANQRGATLYSTIHLPNRGKLDMDMEMVYYPWKRYNINVASSMVKGGISYSAGGENLDFSIKISEKYTSHDGRHRLCSKFAFLWRASSEICLKGQLGAVAGCSSMDGPAEAGWMAAANLKWCISDNRFAIECGGCYFNCPQWSVRMYNYVADLPYTYNSRLLYGEGGCFYLLAKTEISKSMTLYVKGDTIRYITSGKEPGSRVKLAVKYEF